MYIIGDTFTSTDVALLENKNFNICLISHHEDEMTMLSSLEAKSNINTFMHYCFIMCYVCIHNSKYFKRSKGTKRGRVYDKCHKNYNL